VRRGRDALNSDGQRAAVINNRIDARKKSASSSAEDPAPAPIASGSVFSRLFVIY
jgi:hypothetical protein